MKILAVIIFLLFVIPFFGYAICKIAKEFALYFIYKKGKKYER